MNDLGHRLTEKELRDLERRIAALYKEARDSLDETVKAYFESFRKRDEAQKAKLDAGEITKEQYTQWRLNQIGRGERFKALRETMAERYTKANEVAVSYVNDETPGIYSLNRNYAAYTIEKTGADVSFTLFDEQTVKRLMVEAPELMPYYPAARALKRGIDLKYGKKQITASVTTGILQGKSIGKIANDLQTRMETMNRASAIRTARTAVTGAQNAGRQDTYTAAAKMGIRVQKRWRATLDNRTRHAHGMVDGQIVPYDKPFNVDGHKMMFPGDDSAPGYLVYNCRCRMVTGNDMDLEAEPRQRRVRDPATGQNVLINDMTYSEWVTMKQAEDPEAWDIYMKKGRNASADRKQHEDYMNVLGKKVPQQFDDFQNLKYNDPEEWKKIKTLKRQTVFVKNAECETTPKKFYGYFLKEGTNHSDDFFRVGYTKDNPMQLRYDMAVQFDRSKAVDVKVLADGAQKFNIYMDLGVTKTRRFRTGWVQDTEDSKPRIVTAFRNNDG